MPNSLASLVDLVLAWRRVKEELARGRCYAVHPHERQLVEASESEWLASLQRDLEAGTYTPGPLEVCSVPKAGGTVRPGGHLSLRDHVIYTACVGVCSERIRQALDWPDRPRDFSFPIARNPSSVAWIENYFIMWRAFSKKSVEKIDEGIPYVVTVDIAGLGLVDTSGPSFACRGLALRHDDSPVQGCSDLCRKVRALTRSGVASRCSRAKIGQRCAAESRAAPEGIR